MAAVDGDRVPLRVQCAVYGVGTFSTTMYFMAVTIVPLWVAHLDLSPWALGVVLGARPVLPLFLSIHTGALMDRIGGRRVLLFFTILGSIMPLLYPLLPWVAAIFLLQLVWGLCDSMGWLGAQTLVGQLMKARTVYASRLSVVSRIGNIIGPPLVGTAWDWFGPWGAFGTAAAWGLGGVACALALPALPPSAPETVPEPAIDPGKAVQVSGPPRPHRRGGLWALLPDIGDYISAFRLLAIPTVAITAAIGMMTHVGNNVQATFYVVWLNDTGIPGTLIGVLFAVASLAASIGPLLAAPLGRYIRPYWLLWFVVWAAIVLIAITPVLGSFLALAVVLSIRNGLTGLHQPLVISLMLRTAGAGAQGKAIGLRGTCNRLTSVLAPMLMGVVAQFAGIEASFYLIGVLSTIIMAVIAVWMMRHPEIHENAREH